MRANERTRSWHSISTGIKRGVLEICRAGLDFVYPPACLMCGREIASEITPSFCPTCQNDLAPRILDACERCGAPVGPNLETEAGCIHCHDLPIRFDRLFSLGVYKDLLRRACLTAKRHGAEPLARGLGELLWLREREEFESLQIDRVLAVPQHWMKRIRPVHNPSETLARFFSAKLRTKCDHLRIAKTRRTPDQHRLPGSLRRRNLRDAFHLRRPKQLKGQNVLIVDDVLTTGTTINRIVSLLKKAGVRTITVAVIARGIGEAR